MVGCCVARSGRPKAVLVLTADEREQLVRWSRRAKSAQALAMRLWKEGGNDDAAKVRYGFRLCTGRLPDEFEQTRLLQLLQKEQGRFAGNTAAAVYVSSPDLNNLPANMDLHELASWTLVARVLLNLDETITKQ